MPKIWWNGPDSGRGSVEDVVSHTRESVDTMKDAAETLRDVASSILEVHRKDHTSEVKVMHHGQLRLGWRADLDSVVYLEATRTIKHPRPQGYDEEDHIAKASGIEASIHPLYGAVRMMPDKGGS